MLLFFSVQLVWFCGGKRVLFNKRMDEQTKRNGQTMSMNIGKEEKNALARTHTVCLR